MKKRCETLYQNYKNAYNDATLLFIFFYNYVICRTKMNTIWMVHQCFLKYIIIYIVNTIFRTT